ncbi:MAG TPA: N-methyl-L-tryptophan oxidase [Verrucomicrobiae bacterium]
MISAETVVYDVVVVGLGAMGSAAVYRLARRGVKVLGLDRFEPPHTFGSSRGETRVIREAYFEHPSYVPLVQRAYDLWAELEREAEEQLYVKTGGLMIGDRESTVVHGAIQSAREHRLPHEVLGSAEIRKRYTGLNPADEMVGVLEPRAGILFPEKCVAAHLRLAKKLGAEIRTNERVVGCESKPEGILVRSDTGKYLARRVIVSAGPWVMELVRELGAVLQVERQVLLWFETLEKEIFGPERFPIHLWEYEPDKMFYGFPDLGSGLKVAFHHQGEITDAAWVKREVTEGDIAAMRTLLGKYLPAGNGRFLRGTVCLYTNTPDGHFIIDKHPRDERVIVASPCSGHGFKFGSAIGEVLADLAIGGKSRFDLSLFRLGRFN